MRSRLLIAFSLVLSAIYVLTIDGGGFPLRFLVKAGSVAALGVLAIANRHRGLGAGLLISAVGDALLEIDTSLFTGGLGAFLCAHVVYTYTFIRNRNRGPVNVARACLIAGVALFSVAFARWLLPGTGALALPVVLYMIAITAMVISSIGARFDNSWVALGAVLFIISDAILAANKFRSPLPGSEYLVWITYYCAQLLIASGYIRSLTKTRPTPPGISPIRETAPMPERSRQPRPTAHRNARPAAAQNPPS